jgi:hypothetical protein
MAANVTFDRRHRPSVTFAAHIAGNVTLGRPGAPSATLTASNGASRRNRVMGHACG